MLNHVWSWLYVGNESRPFVVLDGLPGLYGLNYGSATACGLPLYLCSYKLDGSITCTLLHFSSLLELAKLPWRAWLLERRDSWYE